MAMPSKMPSKKSMPKAMTQDEVNHSMESGMVPSRYRKNVPKEYQQSSRSKNSRAIGAAGRTFRRPAQASPPSLRRYQAMIADT